MAKRVIIAAAICSAFAAGPAFGVWEYYDYKGVNLYAIQMLSSTAGWIVGAGGGIWRYDGSAWQSVSSPVANDLRAVCLLSATEGWAVGNNGVIVRYNGTSWSVVPSPTDNHLYCVDFVSSGDGWAGGRNGVLLRYAGGTWTLAASPTSRHINGLDMLAANDGWMVTNNGSIYRYNGTAWQPVTSPTANDLYAVKALNPSTAFACGAYQTILRWNGSAWQVESTGPVIYRLNALSVLSGTDAWAVGGEGVWCHLIGSQWYRGFMPWNIEAYGVSFAGPMDGWAVAAGGVIWRYTTGTGAAPTSLGRVKAVFK